MPNISLFNIKTVEVGKHCIMILSCKDILFKWVTSHSDRLQYNNVIVHDP